MFSDLYIQYTILPNAWCPVLAVMASQSVMNSQMLGSRTAAQVSKRHAVNIMRREWNAHILLHQVRFLELLVATCRRSSDHSQLRQHAAGR